MRRLALKKGMKMTRQKKVKSPRPLQPPLSSNFGWGFPTTRLSRILLQSLRMARRLDAPTRGKVHVASGMLAEHRGIKAQPRTSPTAVSERPL